MQPLSNFEIIFFSFSFAFFTVEILRTIKIFGRRPFNIRLLTLKPFSCLMCMSAWAALALSIYSHRPAVNCIGLMFGALFIGAMFDVLKMKFL